jgi:aminopeptidase N
LDRHDASHLWGFQPIAVEFSVDTRVEMRKNVVMARNIKRCHQATGYLIVGAAALFLFFTAALPAVAAAPEGIPRELARERAARIVDPRYNLDYTLVPHATTTSGHEELIFKLKTAGPVLLDFRGKSVSKMVVNGKEVPAKVENGHIELPADLLKLSPNAGQKKKTQERLTDNLGRPFSPDGVIGGIVASEIPEEGVGPNDNRVDIDFTAEIGPAGKAITSFEDKDDGSEYIYTLFVPMDAEMAFPCFDQPDLKARFELTVVAPEEWTVVSNTDTQQVFSIEAGKRKTFFTQTVPISTYLFAFAAGPFFRVSSRNEREPTVFVRQSVFQRAQQEVREVQEITAKGKKYLAGYFDQRYPFGKYDLVLIPGFAYGGMEHAGATFLREESVLFRTAPTRNDLLNRDILVLHELTHQWFGDFVTMRWFDDLWLKEGFAQYMAYHALADLKPKDNVWPRFYESIKPAAYRIDATQGATPIYQDIANLKDAKSAYGAIVYSKAPGILRQLAFVLGEEKFRDGLRLYLKEHAYDNADWSDLVAALEKVSGKSLTKWADVYIRRRGMPQVDVSWSCGAGNRISRFTLKQHDVLGEGGIWPISTQVLLSYANKAPVAVRADLDSASASVKEAVGKPCPAFVFANDQDYAYGRFLLDSRSRRAVERQIGGIGDVFERTLLWGALWESVRDAQLNPREYVDLALKTLPGETDESLAQDRIGHVGTALHRYVSPAQRAPLAARAEMMASNQMLHALDQDLRIVWFRGLRAVAQTPQGRDRLKELLSGKLAVPGVELRQLDRWNMVTALVALDDPQADAVLAAEEKRDPSGDGLKYAYVAKAARAAATTKKKYFDDYLHDTSRPEDWVAQSLGAFNYWNQSDLTLPYLRPALNALPQMKRERKIFFVLGWLNAFIGGQQSAQAQAEVRGFLKTADLDKDLKLKTLEVEDELDRTVKIRAKYSPASSGARNAAGKKPAMAKKRAS